jgi:Tfp pilus assembly protein FimT
VYPGTLTYRGTVPNIELLRKVSVLRSTKGVREIPVISDSSYWNLFDDVVSRSGEVRQMLMRILETNARHRRHGESGFSLIEMMSVVAISMIVAAVAMFGMMPAVKQQHVTNAYNTTLSAMRQARDNAVSQRTSYSVTFSNATTPNTVVVAPALGGSAAFSGDQSSVTYQLPTDVSFLAQQPAVGSTATPDGFGAGLNSIDLGYTPTGNSGGTTTTVIYFCPDGSAQVTFTCAGGNSWDNGVVYISQTGNVLSSRAIDVWGGTGRIHGWRLYGATGGYQWIRQ